MMERMLPQNIEAECGILGSLIIDPEVIDEIAGTLHAEDFYRDAHRTIYETILQLYARKEPADFIMLSDALQVRGKLENIGGDSYLSELINKVPTSGNAPYYANLVAKTALQRRLIHVAGQMAAMAYEGDEDALTRSEALLYQLGQGTNTSAFLSMSEVMTEYMGELDYLYEHRGSIIGVPSGYSQIDLTLGGFQKSDLILLAARPAMGKTALMLCMAYHAALHGKKVAIFSLEMGKHLLARRFTSMVSKVDSQRLRSGWIDDEQWEAIVHSVGQLSSLPISINDTAGNPVASMMSQLRRVEKPDIILVDYLGLVHPDDDAAKRDSVVHQIDAICRGLKEMAREFNVPVITLCQLSREVEKRGNKRPLLSDLRDSGALEQHADVVLFIYRDDYYAALEHRESAAPGLAEVHIAKQRNGPTGEVKLWWEASQTMFYDIVEDDR